MEIFDPPDQVVYQCRRSMIKSQLINNKLYYVQWISPPQTDKERRNIKESVEIIKSISGPQFLKINKKMTFKYHTIERPLIIYNYKKLTSLNEMIAQGKLKDPTVQSIAIFGIASAMMNLHRNRILHGNLYDKVVLFDDEYNPYIIDYGLSKLFDYSKSDISDFICYIAPELISKKMLISRKNDVFAFGMICHLISNGEICFPKKWSSQPIESLIRLGKRPILSDDLSLEIRDIIYSCCQQDPELRPSFRSLSLRLIRNSEYLYFNSNIAKFYSYIDSIVGVQRRKFAQLQKNNKTSIKSLSKFESKILQNNKKTTFYFLNKEGSEDALLSFRLQYSLLNLNRKNVKKRFNFLSKKILILGQDKMVQFCRNVFNIIRIRFRNISLYVDIMIMACKKYSSLQKIMLKELFRTVSTWTYNYYIPNIHFLYYLFKKKLITSNYIVNKIQKLRKKEEYSSYYLCLLLCYFPGEIESQSPELFDDIIKIMQKNQNSTRFPDEFKNFYSNISQLKRDNWKLVHYSIETKNKLISALINDDVDLMCQQLKNKTVDALIDPDIYDPCFLTHMKYPIISAAALYGAMKCFKYLQFNGANMNLKESSKKSFYSFLIAGGNKSLIQYALQSPASKNGLFQSIIFNNMNFLIDYLLKDNSQALFDNESTSIGIFSCSAIANNTSAILNSLNDNPDIVENKDFGRSSIHQAVEYGSIDALQILINRDKTDINSQDIWQSTPLHLAASSDLASTKILCNTKNIELNICDHKGNTALHLAVKYRKKDIVKFLLNETNIDSAIMNNKIYYLFFCTKFLINYFIELHLILLLKIILRKLLIFFLI